jgi:hypothetical protein
MTVTRRQARYRKGNTQRDAGGLPDDLGEIEDEEPLVEEQIARSERRREVLDLLEAIEPDRRAVLVMHVLDDIPMRDVAEALQIPIATAYNRLRLARHDLREAVARKHVADEFDGCWRRWGELAWVRDPTDYYYGRDAITQVDRDRIWARVLDGIGAAFDSIEQAEVDGLRVLSPMFRKGAPPKRYQRPKRAPKGLKSKRVGLPPLPGETIETFTGCRTP